MKINDITTFGCDQPLEGEAYAPPVLKVFGPVGSLTQSGTFEMGEYNMMTMECRVGDPRASDMC